MNKKVLVISLGGSIVVPKEVDIRLLEKFRYLILEQAKRFEKIVIVVGGGYTCRHYQKAARAIAPVTSEQLDWLGIDSSRLNGHLLRFIFGKVAYKELVIDPWKFPKTKKKIIIGSGWKPGNSTDYVSTILAKNYGASAVINLSNISYVYNKDPRKFKDARPLKQVSWQEFRKMIGNRWIPGGNFPFDPVASRLAERSGIKVYFMDGRDLNNFSRFLAGRNFKGTTIG